MDGDRVLRLRRLVRTADEALSAAREEMDRDQYFAQALEYARESIGQAAIQLWDALYQLTEHYKAMEDLKGRN